MKFVSVTELSALGKGAIGLIATMAGLLNVPQVNQAVMKAAAAHPHIAVIAGAVTTLAALLANPQVQKILGVTAPKQ